jgi:hypothetical protein
MKDNIYIMKACFDLLMIGEGGPNPFHTTDLLRSELSVLVVSFGMPSHHPHEVARLQ